MWVELSETLIALVDSLQPPEESGLFITEALLEIPLEVIGGIQEGRPVFYAGLPHSQWKSGVLPKVHLGRLHIQLLEPGLLPGVEHAG
jgi:hypothetical protein